ncbi:MAG: helicase-associated domain-containing protein [Microbacterium sp.]|uniref:helicase-associated domain-containing protein n=1 Tax=Microbacterium sp. TaxID=51671 RepID=UPI0039E3F5E4
MESAAATTSDARALAAELSARSDAELARLLVDRAVPPAAPWRDFFDAAEGLLEAASVDRAVATLPRETLVALAAAGTGAVPPPLREQLSRLALARADGLVHRAVAERVSAARLQHPDAFRLLPAAPPPVPASPAEAAAAAERAALSIASLADVLLSALTAPPGRTGAGAVTAADRKRYVESGAVSSADELDDLLASAAAAGLAAAGEREWLVTDAGERWLAASTAERWQAVADGFRMSVPAALRTASGGVLAPGAWDGAYPLTPDWRQQCALLKRVAARWGLTTPSGAEPEWMAALRAGGAADAAALAALLPPEIDRVYLQADLSAIAPGPLAPALDLRLRGMAARESRAQASTYRFTPESITVAVGAGETSDSLRAFLSELSLTGIPQPLDYLIETTAARHGLIRVRADAASGRTRVETDEPALLDTLAVDQSVRAVGLVRDGDALASRVARDAVYWTLVDARYPVVAVDADGEPEPVHRRRIAGAAPGAATHERLLEVLREAREHDSDAAWLGRELDAAVRAKATIVVVAALPDGSTREFTLEATGLGGGRLRGRDRGSDTERTLPVSSIVSTRPA